MLTTEDKELDKKINDILQKHPVLTVLISGITTPDGTKAFIEAVNKIPLTIRD